MGFGCFSSKSVQVVDSSAIIERKGVGRMEPQAEQRVPEPHNRDGLHTAPVRDHTAPVHDTSPRPTRAKQETFTPGPNTPGHKARAGLHSAPHERSGGESQKNLPPPPAPEPAAQLGVEDFVIERAGGPTAQSIDAYLTDIVGARMVKELRSTDWADRVNALENLAKEVTRSKQNKSTVDRLTLFRATITILARCVQDKVVPVYLPALGLLAQIYTSAFLAPIAHMDITRSAIHLIGGQIVLRAGSSNVRAREESASAFLHLARSEHAGPVVVCPHALRPLSNSKAQHAAVARLELLRTIVSEFGLGKISGLQVEQVGAFALPLCESASEKTREAAYGLLADMYGAKAKATMAYLTEQKPNVAQQLARNMGADSDSDSPPPQQLSISGKKMPAALPPLQSGSANEVQLQDGVIMIPAGPPPRSAPKHTPIGAEARAKARSTATELGARSPPRQGARQAPLRKKSRSPAPGSAEKRGKNQRVHTPRPGMDEGSFNGGLNNSNSGLFDGTDEDLMEAILDAEEVP